MMLITGPLLPDVPILDLPDHPTTEPNRKEFIMSEVIQPGPGQTVITTDEWRGHRDHYRDVATGHEARDIHRDVVHGTEEEQENFAAVSRQIADANTSTLVGFKDLTALGYQVEGRGLVEASKNTSYLSTQAERTFGAVTVQNERIFGALTVQAERIGDAAALDRAKLAAIAAAQLAECCCELKLQAAAVAAEAAKQLAECCCEMKLMQKDTFAKISDDGNATRAMLQAREIQDLRDKLNLAIRVPPVIT